MKNKVEQIMENYRKGIKKIDKQYKVKEVKEIDTKDLDEKIEYEKSFIEKLETQGRDENLEIINRAKDRLEIALKEKEEKEKAYEEEKNKREEKLSEIPKLKNKKVILPSGREVTQAEKDEMDRNDLKNKAIRELTQESNRISEELIKKNKELEAKREEWNNFKYEYEKDENGNSTGKSINDADVIKIHKEYDDIKKEMIELNKMQEDCNKYLEEFRQKDNEKMKKFSETWNEVSTKNNKTQEQKEKMSDDKSTTEVKTKIGDVETNKNTRGLENGTNNLEEQNLNALGKRIIKETEQEEAKNEQHIISKEELVKEKPEIIISRKPTIRNYGASVQIGTIRKMLGQKPEEVMDKLQKILPDKSPEYLEKMSGKIDAVLLEGIIQLKEKNMLTSREVMETIEKFDSESVIPEEMNFKVVYDMRDLSKGAFWPWNRKDRDMIAQIAEDNKQRGIAEFKDGEEYEPNPIKRMFKRINITKIGDGKGEVSQTEYTNSFKQVVKDAAKKSEYDQMLDDIYKATSVEELESIFNKAKNLTRDGKISTTDIAGINNIIINKKGTIQKQGTALNEEKDKEEEATK